MMKYIIRMHLQSINKYCKRTAFSLLLICCALPVISFAQASWGPDARLTYLYGDSYNPRAVCCGDTIHLVWWESYTHVEVFYKRSTDAGETWGVDMLLSIEDAQASSSPKIAVSNDTVHVVWAEDDFGLLYRRSIDGGSIWQDIDSIIYGMGYSDIQAFGDTIYICGVNGSTGDLRFAMSTDGGNNWTPAISITPASSSPSLRRISKNNLNLVISYTGFPISEVYNVRSYNGGESWLDSQMVSENDTRVSSRPAMDTDDSTGIHISWYDHKYSPYPWTGDIFYRASRDSGSTWEAIDSLTVQHRAMASDILAEGNNLHLVWEDDRHDFGDNFEIYYRMSTDLGQSWEQEVRLTDTVNWSRRPSLACDGSYLHLFWFDQRDDTSNILGEIYYKRKDLSQGITEVEQMLSATGLLFRVYPTLFTGRTFIMQSAWGKEQGGKDQSLNYGALPYDMCVRVYDISGKEVSDYEIEEQGGQIMLNAGKLPCGVYFVEVQADSIHEVHKVVKVK